MANMQLSGSKMIPMVGETINKSLINQGIELNTGAEARHPVERLLLDGGRRTEQQEMMAKSIVFGQHAPLRAKMERNLLSQFQRLPGLPSSLVGLETVLDMDDTIEFEDVFNLEADAPVSRSMGANFGLHEVMESRLNMRF
mmetsp:Transcript_21826/g.48233  ORF Transcript_21826/g.48233 Transcript_21826/m.48233 type:complete len:141 (+) Transcript_21826:85-507(+)